MTVRMLYFAWVREAVGMGEETISPPADVNTAAALVNWLAAQGQRYADAFADRDRLRVAIDQTFAPMHASIVGAKEIALFPPVTGG